MEQTNELMRQRIDKVQELRDLGIDPYPYRYDPDTTAKQILETYAEAGNEPDEDDPVCVSGRIMTKRDHGHSGFAHLQDHTGQIQIYISKKAVGADQHQIYKKFDVGDLIGVEGPVFRTRTGEVTVMANRFQLLSKSIRPLPEKFHGLQDIETRYRQRYADLIVNPDVKQVFIHRTQIIQSIRTYLNQRGFLEVETPILQPIYGGANARPFITHHNTLGMDLYLRIANELYLKRLIVGGIDRVYEFAKDFRNEGMDRDHNPEFTMIELYQAFADYQDMMRLTENLVSHVAQTVFGQTKIQYQETAICYDPPWPRMTMFEAIKEVVGIDVSQQSQAELADLLQSTGEAPDRKPASGTEKRGELIAEVFATFVEPKLIQPTFIYDYPVEVSPLAKKKRDDDSLVERFEFFIYGMELGNAFSELNDPMDQRERFVEQSKKRADGDEEAFLMDEDYLRALEYGMPPTGGLGIGIDRLTMLLTDQSSIRDVILFPQMKPEL